MAPLIYGGIDFPRLPVVPPRWRSSPEQCSGMEKVPPAPGSPCQDVIRIPCGFCRDIIQFGIWRMRNVGFPEGIDPCHADSAYRLRTALAIPFSSLGLPEISLLPPPFVAFRWNLESMRIKPHLTAPKNSVKRGPREVNIALINKTCHDVIHQSLIFGALLLI